MGLGSVEGVAKGVVSGVEGRAAYFCFRGVEGIAERVVAGNSGELSVGCEGGDDEEDDGDDGLEFHSLFGVWFV